MRKELFIIFLMFIFSGVTISYAQNIDSININRARELTNKFIKDPGKAEFWLYNLNEDYILISKKEGKLLLHYIQEKAGIKDSAILYQRDSLINRMFYQFKCSKCFTYASTDTIAKYNYWHKGYIYFLYYKNGQKICEFNLPTLFQLRGKNKNIYPIKDELNDYLFSKLSYYANVKHRHRKK